MYNTKNTREKANRAKKLPGTWIHDRFGQVELLYRDADATVIRVVATGQTLNLVTSFAKKRLKRQG